MIGTVARDKPLHEVVHDAQVLVVDDADGERKELHSLVEAEGYRAMSAGSGQEALDFLKGTPVALVIAELFMPGIDGWELLDTVKKQYPDVHVVVTTGSISEQGEALLKSRKADGYLIKPVKERPMQILLRALLLPDNLDRSAEVVAVSADPNMLQTIDDALGERGIAVQPFSSVRRAVSYIWSDPPDLIVTDMNVGRESGFELVRQVRSDKKLPFIPIIMVVGDATKEQIAGAVQLRVNGVLSQPLASEILSERVLKLLRQYGRAT
ncbi:MAG: CheY-like chemotaxis protein [Candidatus Latescibacterota bacterium]|jgi:CheY-like chemotaxis protein